MTRFLRLFASLLLFSGLAGAAGTPGVAGKWTLSLDTPHGKVSMDLVLKQDGRKITGTLSSPSASDVPLSGEFADGALAVTTAPKAAGSEPMEIRGRLLEDGMLTGYVSSSRGDAKFTGKRAPDPAK